MTEQESGQDKGVCRLPTSSWMNRVRQAAALIPLFWGEGGRRNQGTYLAKVVRVYSFSVLPVLPCYLVIIIELFDDINHVQDVTVLPFVFNI